MGARSRRGVAELTQLVLERRFDPPLKKQDVIDIANSGAWCFQQYQVDWLGSMLSDDGSKMICRFEGRDTETIRQALARIDADLSVFWRGTVHEADTSSQPNVVVERSFSAPVAIEDIQQKENASQWCLDAHQVRFVRTFFSTDRMRMLCLYSAPDTEAVLAAQRKADMPLDAAWSFEEIGMADAFG